MILTIACSAQPAATSPASPVATPTPASVADTPVPTPTQSAPNLPTATNSEPVDNLTPTEPAPVSPKASDGVASDIRNFTLEDLTVPAGTTVTWTNRDGASHTATSGTPQVLAGIWDSGVLSREDSFTFTFNESGEFPYFCAIHNSMRGTVTVTG